MSDRSFRVEIECPPGGQPNHRHVLEVASTGYVPGAVDLREVALQYTCPRSGSDYKAIFTPLGGYQRPFRVVSVS